MSDNRNQNNGQRKLKIDPDAIEFAKATLKRYKKKNADFYDSKKELKSSYNIYLIELLPKTIEFVVRYGYIKADEVPEVKEAIYAKLVDPEFIKMLKKEIKNGTDIENIKLLPIIIKDILVLTGNENRELLAKDPNAKIYDMSDLVELSQLILKKKLKKMEKAGIDMTVAFDALSVIPCPMALNISKNYRIHMFFETMYEAAKEKTIPFKELMELLVDEEYLPVIIAFILLERKEKFASLNEAQKVLYLAITTWAFDTMESLKKPEIEAILKTYVSTRNRDESQGKDSNRRYALGSLSENDYQKIANTITKMIADDATKKKYF